MTRPSPSTPVPASASGRTVSGRTVLRLDAAFEALLAALCLTWALRLFGTDTWTLPPWLAGPVLFGVAAVLVGAAVGLWLLADRADPAALRVVAIANALTALAALTWAITCDGGPLRIVLSTVAVALAVLAPTQLHLSRRPLQP